LGPAQNNIVFIESHFKYFLQDFWKNMLYRRINIYTGKSTFSTDLNHYHYESRDGDDHWFFNILSTLF